MSDEAAVKWLREQIEADLSAATIISNGGFAPERWDTDPRGQVNAARMPECDAITRALGEDPDDVAFPRHAFWTALVSWEKENNEAEDERVRESDLPVAIVNNGRREANHISRHDPLNTVADCEAKLAILDEHYILFADDQNEAYEEFSVVRVGGADQDHGCVTCHCYGQGAAKGYGYCRTVRALASAYRYRDGYEEHWGDA
jgi:Family of unknown function (DUF6221)